MSDTIGARSASNNTQPVVFKRRLFWDLADQVAEKHGLSVSDLLGRSRERRIAHARHELMFLAYDSGRYSLPQIGIFLKVDHSSVVHGRDAHKRRMAS